MQVKYISNSDRLVPPGVFKKYPQGIIISKGKVLELTDGEWKSVQKWASGPHFEELRTARVRQHEDVKNNEVI